MYFKCYLLLVFAISCISARIHNIQIKNDNRKFIRLSNFAFNKEGILHIKLSNFTFHPDKQHFLFGLTLDRIHSDGLNTYLHNAPNRCVILEKILGEKFDFADDNSPIIYFPFDLRNKKVKLHCGKSFNDIQIKPFIRYNNLNATKNIVEQENLCSHIELPINYVLTNENNYYNIDFTINIKRIKDEGIYNVFFHNCANYDEENHVFVDFNVQMQEKNGEIFLSSTETNLPKLYSILALLYLLSGAYWAFVLWKRKSAVLKIHILMAISFYLKFISIFLKYIDYKYVEQIGEPSIIWSNLYYIIYFFEVIFFFVTIILIASGWTIIKTNLQRKIKIILLLVTLLQITAYITNIYLDKMDKDDNEYKKIKELFLITDLLSCILSLFPAVWTLRQLKRNSELEEDDAQLILFKKHFVLLIVCIYFTRIIPFLIKLVVAEHVQYAWLAEFSKELTYFVCFTLIGFIFRPIIKSYLTAISDDVNDIDSSIPIKDNFNKFNEHWTSSTNIINAMDDEEEAGLLSEIKGKPLF